MYQLELVLRFNQVIPANIATMLLLTTANLKASTSFFAVYSVDVPSNQISGIYPLLDRAIEAGTILAYYYGESEG